MLRIPRVEPVPSGGGRSCCALTGGGCCQPHPAGARHRLQPNKPFTRHAPELQRTHVKPAPGPEHNQCSLLGTNPATSSTESGQLLSRGWEAVRGEGKARGSSRATCAVVWHRGGSAAEGCVENKFCLVATVTGRVGAGLSKTFRTGFLVQDRAGRPLWPPGQAWGISGGKSKTAQRAGWRYNSFYSVYYPMVQKGLLAWHQSLEKGRSPLWCWTIRPAFSWSAVPTLQAHNITDTVWTFPENPGYDSPGAKRITLQRLTSRGPDHTREGGSISGSLRKQCADSQLSCALLPKGLLWSQRSKTTAGTQNPRAALLPAAASVSPRASSCKQFPCSKQSQLPCQLLVLSLQQQEHNQFCPARYFCQTSVSALCSCTLLIQSPRVQLASSGSHCSWTWWQCKLWYYK